MTCSSEVDYILLLKPRLQNKVSYYAARLYMVWNVNDKMKKHTGNKITLIGRSGEALDFGESGSVDPIPGIIPPPPYKGAVVVPGGGGCVTPVAGVVPGTDVLPGATDPPAVLENFNIQVIGISGMLL